ncbi:MAG: alkaline phosphatase family protein [Kutzneria sp.]|nr:alkaline phosphatase family protein [Kutzneria sp.]
MGVQRHVRTVAAAATCLALTACGGGGPAPDSAAPDKPTTPIEHLVVIFGENISFDHYFGTYPHAANSDGTTFTAAETTPGVNGLTAELLSRNSNAYQPRRLTPAQALTCDQAHDYGPEQKATDKGAMDKFVENTGRDTCTGQPILFGEPGLVMDYYDGNTVTALWNYAQHFALSDNSFNTVFGPSTPGAINLVSGQTHGVLAVDPGDGEPVTDTYVAQSPGDKGVGTITEDPDPAFDDCSDSGHTHKDALASMQGRNIGDLLNAKNVSWGWFQGGFRPTGERGGFQVCGATHANIGGNQVNDYVPHHEPFQYYKSTANPKHRPPTSTAMIGHTDQANHQYDLADFDAALRAGNLPSVSFLKAPAYQNAHAGNSDPLDEQRFLVERINALQASPDWASTAVVLAYDDSDGWYDHVPPPIVNGSSDPKLDQADLCGHTPAAGGYQDRCGYGPRLPLLVISPYSKVNSVDHTRTDQTSVLRFIEDNWRTGRIGDFSLDERAGGLEGMLDFSAAHRKAVILDPKTGAVTGG